MKTFFRIFFTSFIVLLVVMAVAMATHTKAELHLLLNSHHTEGLDTFFRYYTKMAEFPLYIIAGLALLFWRAAAFRPPCREQGMERKRMVQQVAVRQERLLPEEMR